MKSSTRAALIGAALACLGGPGRAEAQEDALAGRCAQVAAPAEAAQVCRLVAQSIEIAQAPLALALTGGNPVPGTASTLGLRLGTLPRVSLGARATGVWIEVPRIQDLDRPGDIGILLPGLNVDGAIGVFGGASPAPLVGGVGSLDLLASVGVLPLPGSFEDGSPFSWGLGARLGILRESFVLPGVSLSGMYRRLGRVTYGDPRLVEDDAFFSTEISNLSARAAISKRLFGFGATAGLGYDRTSSDLRFAFVDPGTGAPVGPITFDGFDDDRFSGFVNVSWTLLILHLVAEGGWQQGADRVPGTFPAGFTSVPTGGNFFGSLALRLSI